jgi:hypothetical protein
MISYDHAGLVNATAAVLPPARAGIKRKKQGIVKMLLRTPAAVTPQN